MTHAQPPAAQVHIEEETVRMLRHRQSITKRMTRKQTEIRLGALEALDKKVRSEAAPLP